MLKREGQLDLVTRSHVALENSSGDYIAAPDAGERIARIHRPPD